MTTQPPLLGRHGPACLSLGGGGVCVFPGLLVFEHLGITNLGLSSELRLNLGTAFRVTTGWRHMRGWVTGPWRGLGHLGLYPPPAEPQPQTAPSRLNLVLCPS